MLLTDVSKLKTSEALRELRTLLNRIYALVDELEHRAYYAEAAASGDTDRMPQFEPALAQPYSK